ncbi:Rab GTPase-binding exocyst subunit S15 [Tieghemiomyces parasiticus]|uniref:Rab GTPase-binding exocyst subunit S15 n=1 Tax=Tieghemiomyces parasiticus TaxID=78921 RepID=A0A9W8DUW9_9FUNG|nr:Rab GTPase-binding exocyst subunit S15 [Tieghemiomyces parasiticus]
MTSKSPSLPSDPPGALATVNSVINGPLGLSSLGSGMDPEQLEQLGPVIRSVYRTGKQDQFKTQLQALAQQKEAEMERLCGSHHGEFVRAVDELLQIRQNSVDLHDEVQYLNQQLQQSGRDLSTKQAELLNLKRVHRNIHMASQCIASSLDVVKMADRVIADIGNREFYSALRTLGKLKEDHLPPLLVYSFARYLYDSLPAIEIQLRDAVLADMREWFAQLRAKSNQMGRHLMESMAQRQDVWATRRRNMAAEASDGNDGRAGLDYVSTAVEFVLDEDIAHLQPLYQCLHIHDKLGHRKQFKQSFEEDRRTQANQMVTRRFDFKLGSLEGFRGKLHDIIGFFIIEYQIVTTTRDFRSKTEVDSLWDSVITNFCDTLAQNVQDIVGKQSVLTSIKQLLLTFTFILEDYSYDVRKLKELNYAMLSF